MKDVPAPSDPPPALPRLDGIDTLRGLSILAVVLLHIRLRCSFQNIPLGTDWVLYAQHFVFQNGGNGVTVFFAVSGFLITLTSLRRFGSLGAMRPRLFYRIRFARIMPLLLLLLAVLSVLHLAHAYGFVIDERYFTLPRALLAALTFHLNWLEPSRHAWLPICWSVLWSLSIEEMFYLFFPLVCVVLLRRGGRWGVAACIGLALALVVMGPFAGSAWARTYLQPENSYLAGMAIIVLGCLTAMATDKLSRRTLHPRALWAMQLAGWAVLLLIAIWPRWPMMTELGKSGLDGTLLGLGTCLVMCATTLRGAKGKPWTEPLRWFGRHSYEVYLSHQFVVLTWVKLFAHYHKHGAPRSMVAGFVVAMVLATAALGWALARWFSEPANRWLRGARMAK